MQTQALIDYLEQLQAKGISHVSLDEKAKAIMREFYIRATQPNRAKVKPHEKADNSQTSTAPVTIAKVTGHSTAEKLQSLRDIHQNYQPFKNLGTLRKKLVFPTTPEKSDILFVGEAPGYHDERKGAPFAGPAGEKLDGILKAMSLDRAQIHITYILKYRPSLPSQTTNNRPANEEELQAAKALIDQEINILQPKVIISLGESAARFFSKQQADLDTIRQSEYSYLSTPLITTYHPSFLLHTQDTTDKRRLWEDMLKVMELVGLPISEKQRNYFSKRK